MDEDMMSVDNLHFDPHSDTESELSDCPEDSLRLEDDDGESSVVARSSYGRATQCHHRGKHSHHLEGGKNYRADLERMTSMRIPPIDKASSQGPARHRPTRSPVASAAGAAAESEQPADANGSHVMVLDFFRQVNKDARVLKRMGSNGMHGFSGFLFRCFASCLRKLGLGNPAASVNQMAFDNDNPLDTTAAGERALRWSGSVRGKSTSGEFVMDEDMDDDDDEGADAHEISEQKKKVHDLGELPALDWTNVSRNLLFCIITCGGLLLTTLFQEMDNCVQMGGLCMREWCYAICVAVGAYFVIEFLAKLVAVFFKWTLLLHTNNNVWIFIRLHKDVSLTIWSVLLLGLWTWFSTTKWSFDDTKGVVSKILGIFLAYTAVRVLNELCKVEMAHRYMWRPYVERARASIWSQYVIFMMTDHTMGVATKDEEGQQLALGFSKARKINEHLSLYTVGKAIGFVHANALRHPLGGGRPGTDKDGVINSKTGARLFGGLLYDALMIKFKDEASKDRAMSPVLEGESPPEHGDVAPFVARKQGSRKSPAAVQPLKPSVTLLKPSVTLPRPSPIDIPHRSTPTICPSGLRPILAPSYSIDAKSPLRRRLSSVKEDTETLAASGVAYPDDQLHEEDQGEQENIEGESNTTEEEEKWSPSATTLDAAETSYTNGCAGATTQHNRCVAAETGRTRGGSGHHRRVSSSAPGSHKGITLANLRQMTSKALALQIMDLYEVPPDGHISRKVFIEHMVDVFVQRRSLQLTLGDYEAILKKVGYLLGVVSAVIVFFVSLRILGYNIGSLVLTWLSLAVAFSFLFGSSASAFFESTIFVFVTKAYDVGDPVFFVDDTGHEDWYIVTRINMLTTVFRRWDGQATLLPNNLMAKKAIRNQWRSGPMLHHTMIAVSIDTPMDKLDQMKAGIAAGMRSGRHRHNHGEGGLKPDTVDYQLKGLADGNRLSVFILCKQRENGSNMGRRFGNASLFLKLITKECHRLGITYSMPSQPVMLSKGGLEAWHAREAFLGGEGGGMR